MKKNILTTTLFAATIILVGNGCPSTLITEIEQNPLNSKSATPTTAASAAPTSPVLEVEADLSAQENATPRERGMARIHVLSAATKLPIAGITLVVENSSQTKVTNSAGWAEFPASTGNIYVPKLNGFLASQVVSTADGNENGDITILLTPEK